MDGDVARLQKKLEDLLREAAEVSVALNQADGTIRGVPHYSVIERRAHELGKSLSRRIQERQMAEIVANQVTKGTCPACGGRWDLVATKRTGGCGGWSDTPDGDEGLLRVVPEGLFPPSGKPWALTPGN